MKVSRGGEVTRDEAIGLIQLKEAEDIRRLLEYARLLTLQLHGRKPALCSIVNAKSGVCPEDCSFCAQSSRYRTGVRTYPLLDVQSILGQAAEAKANGAGQFCIVTSGRVLSRNDFCELLKIIVGVRQRMDIEIHVSIGFLNRERVRQLKSVGVTEVNHNIQTSKNFYSRIVRTHAFEDRLRTLCAVREESVKLCCGVLWGLGESKEDRMDAAFELKPFHPECVPINLLDPRPGTPLERASPLEPLDVLRFIAVYRFILPDAVLRLAGGRVRQLGGMQQKALQAGINGLIIGKLLTTEGNSVEGDRALLRNAGFEI